jgi:hypothetical protein
MIAYIIHFKVHNLPILLSEIGQNRRKLFEIAENGSKSPKIGQNRRKWVQIAENNDPNIPQVSLFRLRRTPVSMMRLRRRISQLRLKKSDDTNNLVDCEWEPEKCQTLENKVGHMIFSGPTCQSYGNAIFLNQCPVHIYTKMFFDPKVYTFLSPHP